jgi:hypothetical protein
MIFWLRTRSINNIAEMQTVKKKLPVFVAVKRTCKFTFVEVGQMTATQFPVQSDCTGP